MRRTRPVGASLVLAVVAALALPSAAAAHRASSYYDLRWGTLPTVEGVDGDIVLEWAFSPTFEADARDDGIAATEAWNVHAGRLRFAQVADLAADPGIASCDLFPPHVARRGPIDGAAYEGGGILAVAVLCPVPGTTILHHFTVTYDDAEPWHVGEPPIPFDRFDLRGILAHEFGHATGWGRHFDETTGTECIQSLRHTMCSTVAPGTADPRDLEPHDVHTFQDAY